MTLSEDHTLAGVEPLSFDVPIRHVPQADKLEEVGFLAWAENLLATADQLERIVGDRERVQRAVGLIAEWDRLYGQWAEQQWASPTSFNGKLRDICRNLVGMIGVRATAAALDEEYELVVTLALRGGLDTEVVLAVSDALIGRDAVNVTKLSQELGCNYSLVQKMAQLMNVERSKHA